MLISHWRNLMIRRKFRHMQSIHHQWRVMDHFRAFLVLKMTHQNHIHISQMLQNMSLILHQVKNFHTRTLNPPLHPSNWQPLNPPNQNCLRSRFHQCMRKVVAAKNIRIMAIMKLILQVRKQRNIPFKIIIKKKQNKMNYNSNRCINRIDKRGHSQPLE